MEDKIQAKFHKELRNTYPNTSGLCCHVPNGGLRSQSEAMRFKAMGVLAGWPDYQIMIPANGFHGLFIEFKDKDKGTNRGLKLTKHQEQQKKIQQRLILAGYKVVECTSWEQAISEFELYAQNTLYLQKRVS